MLESTPAPSLWQRLLSSLLGVLALVGATLMMVGALLLGLLLALGVMLWALLRGRRPGAVNLRWGTMPGRRGFGRPADPAPPGEVVDVQVRELRDTQDSRERPLP
jgi:hypothetical protein